MSRYGCWRWTKKPSSARADKCPKSPSVPNLGQFQFQPHQARTGTRNRNISPKICKYHNDRATWPTPCSSIQPCNCSPITATDSWTCTEPALTAQQMIDSPLTPSSNKLSSWTLQAVQTVRMFTGVSLTVR